MIKKYTALLLVLLLIPAAALGNGAIPYWSEESPAMASIVSFVDAMTDESSPDYVMPENRVVLFDFDGTLYGERFPSYFDVVLMLARVLHDPDYQAPAEHLAHAQALEQALFSHQGEPESPLSNSQISAEAFAGMTVDEYRAYIRRVMETPAWGFENMTYGEGFFLPMVALVQYLWERDFRIFISSGSERILVRELVRDRLGAWIAPSCVIGSTLSLKATAQGDKKARSYTLARDDQILLAGNLDVKNQKASKVFSAVQEIGQVPVLVFGNSSGDLAMAQYALQYGGRGYMLLCDDLRRDYGDLEVAEAFAKECEEMGLETISMKDDFATIYGEHVRKTDEGEEEKPAA